MERKENYIVKVLYLTNVPAPYRVEFFEYLGKLCDLTVVYDVSEEELRDRDERWFANSFENHIAIFVKQTDFLGMKVGFDIIKIIRNGKFDHIVVGIYSTPTAMLAIEYMRIFNIPYILSSDGGFIKDESRIAKMVKCHFIRGAKSYLSTGKNTDKYLAYYGADTNKIYRYILTSVNNQDIINQPVSIEKKKKYRRECGINEDYVFIMVGQFIPRKGIDLLLKAYAQTKTSNTGLYIIGGKVTEEYLEIVRNLKIKNVHFRGFMSKEDLLKMYLCSDVFVMPTREDIWGLVVNEAFACGLPVITSTKCNAGNEMIINGYNGYIMDETDIDQLSQYMDDMASDYARTMQMSQAAIQTIKKYSIENSAIDFHERLIEIGGV